MMGKALFWSFPTVVYGVSACWNVKGAASSSQGCMHDLMA